VPDYSELYQPLPAMVMMWSALELAYLVNFVLYFLQGLMQKQRELELEQAVCVE